MRFRRPAPVHKLNRRVPVQIRVDLTDRWGPRAPPTDLPRSRAWGLWPAERAGARGKPGTDINPAPITHDLRCGDEMPEAPGVIGRRRLVVDRPTPGRSGRGYSKFVENLRMATSDCVRKSVPRSSRPAHRTRAWINRRRPEAELFGEAEILVRVTPRGWRAFVFHYSLGPLGVFSRGARLWTAVGGSKAQMFRAPRLMTVRRSPRLRVRQLVTLLADSRSQARHQAVNVDFVNVTVSTSS